jgi:hypothetical protein
MQDMNRHKNTSQAMYFPLWQNAMYSQQIYIDMRRLKHFSACAMCLSGQSLTLLDAVGERFAFSKQEIYAPHTAMPTSRKARKTIADTSDCQSTGYEAGWEIHSCCNCCIVLLMNCRSELLLK